MLLYDGFKMFNELPNEIRSQQALLNFKRALVVHIKSGRM